MNHTFKDSFRRWAGISLLAIAALASGITFNSLRPGSASAAAPTPAAAPLSDDSVSPLLSLDKAMENLASRVTPAIVNVAVTSHAKNDGPDAQQEMPDDMQQFFGPGMPGMPGGPNGPNFRFRGNPQQPRIEHGIGSGVIISPDGYIVTNNHVVDGATEIRVTMSDRRILTAKLIGTDPLTDLAVIKIDGSNFPSVPFGDSTVLQPGQTVLAFGNPYGLRFTVTRGIVSGLNRPNPFGDDRRKPGEFIQTDAAINPGNSGGPLVDARGQVIGINTFLLSPSGAFAGMGFAIPTQIVKPTVDSLIKYGKVSHGYMGIGISDVTPENAKFFNLHDANGAVVTQVENGSPASKAGVKVGDVITELDGRKIADAGALQVEVGQKQPGTEIKLEVMRDGKSVNVPVTLADMNKSSEETKEASAGDHGKMRWGIGISDLTPDMREQLQAPKDLHGALIGQVQPGSPADDAGLQQGDVIMQVNRHDVDSASDVQKQLSSVPKGQDALVLVWSNGGNTFRVLHAPEGS
ncbi:MAG TPA: trypsin-like peptidase domain-containing protein [Terriglobales bacterium]